MSLYNESGTLGELWLRNPSGFIQSANKTLSSIYLKYSEIPKLYDNLIKNEITRFDVFYDCIFIETLNGCFFEKIVIGEDESFQSFTRNYFFNEKKTTQIDYWFNEKDQKVFFTDIEFLSIQNNSLKFLLNLKEFDCNSGITEQRVREVIELYFINPDSWFNFIPTIETPKICYNPTTSNYNISFIFRSKSKQFALISLMISKKRNFEISKIDGIVPFLNLDIQNSRHYSLL
jgi:hypothetical protein